MLFYVAKTSVLFITLKIMTNRDPNVFKLCEVAIIHPIILVFPQPHTRKIEHDNTA